MGGRVSKWEMERSGSGLDGEEGESVIEMC